MRLAIAMPSSPGRSAARGEVPTSALLTEATPLVKRKSGSAQPIPYSLWPFGRTVVKRPEAGGASVVGNVLWLLLAGWWLALLHLGSALLLAITIIGLPLAVANVKLVPAALWPFGREIVRSADVSAALAAYRAQQAEAQAQQELERPIPPPVELPKAAEEPPELAPGERRKT
jgi:uncharacterized membrane protein YccF (DUF307 family)